MDSTRVVSVGSRLLKLLEERVHDSSNVMFILLRRQMLEQKSMENCFDHFGMRRLLEEALRDPEALAKELSALRDDLCQPGECPVGVERSSRSASTWLLISLLSV